MAGIINKIGDALHIGGNKEEDKHHKEEEKHHKAEAEHHKAAEHKEGGGVMDKIKDKIHGGDKDSKGECHDGKKKKKDKKKKEHGHDHDHGSSSSSDSD